MALDLIGSSPRFRAVLTDVERIAPVDSAVLIQGETGTGKEVIARAIHEAVRAGEKQRHSGRSWPEPLGPKIEAIGGDAVSTLHQFLKILLADRIEPDAQS
jgi:sigma54-dependent transcription regulator